MTHPIIIGDVHKLDSARRSELVQVRHREDIGDEHILFPLALFGGIEHHIPHSAPRERHRHRQRGIRNRPVVVVRDILDDADREIVDNLRGTVAPLKARDEGVSDILHKVLVVLLVLGVVLLAPAKGLVEGDVVERVATVVVVVARVEHRLPVTVDEEAVPVRVLLDLLELHLETVQVDVSARHGDELVRDVVVDGLHVADHDVPVGVDVGSCPRGVSFAHPLKVV